VWPSDFFTLLLVGDWMVLQGQVAGDIRLQGSRVPKMADALLCLRTRDAGNLDKGEDKSRSMGVVEARQHLGW
jgi:hypothetical protein